MQKTIEKDLNHAVDVAKAFAKEAPQKLEGFVVEQHHKMVELGHAGVDDVSSVVPDPADVLNTVGTQLSNLGAAVSNSVKDFIESLTGGTLAIGLPDLSGGSLLGIAGKGIALAIVTCAIIMVVFLPFVMLRFMWRLAFRARR